MKVVAFGSETLSRFPYRDLLEVLPAECRYYVGAGSDSGGSGLDKYADVEDVVRDISVEDCRRLPADETTAIVTEPLWVSAFGGWRPERMVAVMADLSFSTAAQRRWANLVAAVADAVFVRSETQYLQWCFQRPTVFFWDPYRCRQEAVHWASRVIGALEDPEELRGLEKEQWHSRLKEYQGFVGREEIAEKALYFSAAYRYLLEDPAAREDLLASFERAVASGRADCLVTHYRFLSAILAKQGRLEEAVQAYGVTALDQAAKWEYERLLTWLEDGRQALVRARLFLLNDDLRSAREVLSETDGEEAGRLRLEIAWRTGYPDQAFREVAPADCKTHSLPQAVEILEGLFHWLQGDRPGAIHHFLRAAAEDPNALGYILEMDEAESLLEQIRRGERAS
ncbi:hypothetical protein [Kyrpidia tusciae]|uniref:Uncharacterized protein n=1 Tax=Kyrpidia tusciae (strain DSM 2912 / NBRC 15312 / T2) TaxID=562970 RepID=D5WXI7_KYRT2|nr:hypothetical protein [Kyrpidia tusciae]ADG05908.1 hypothetical protein Btus_1181 [Kyrpidia tusciae DSM 2912]